MTNPKCQKDVKLEESSNLSFDIMYLVFKSRTGVIICKSLLNHGSASQVRSKAEKATPHSNVTLT